MNRTTQHWRDMTPDNIATLCPGHQGQLLTAAREDILQLALEREHLMAALERIEQERDRLDQIINTPQADDFIRAVSTEAEHQRQRWPSEHDDGKTPADWFWLIGYLAGKALAAHVTGDHVKAEHHIITTAAACLNWHRSMFGRTNMRPGHEHGIHADDASYKPLPADQDATA